MAATEDLIDFNVIESHKENIQALPSGRSAKALAQIYSPPLLGANASPAFTNDAHQKARAAFERELLQTDEADDPLDIYNRYVKWTLDTYPSAQATPQSQLLPLLERATKAFQSSAQYKNDSRYLKLWLHYIRLFSDAPREVFVFLARNNIGESLALYYEEYAAWLENAGRWNQAEEIYQMGIDKEARPIERLSRKYNEFMQRKDVHAATAEEPSSPALPAARPALAAKIDPFAASTQPQQQAGSTTKKPKSNKMQIFADTDDAARPSSGGSSKGWDNIGTLSERRKENHIAARPMAGETLKAGKTNGGMQKMTIFRDTTSKKHSLPRHLTDPARRSAHAKQCVINPKNGRLECVAVNLEAVYPAGKRSEMCFEELRAQHRGWRAGAYPKEQPRQVVPKTASPQRKKGGFKIFEDNVTSQPPPVEQSLSQKFSTTLILDQENDENSPPDAARVVATKKARKEERANRTRKIDIPDVKHIKNETKTIQLNMDSPTGAKPKRKKSIGKGEATMTINTKEAMDEIYGIFSQPLPSLADTSIDEDENEESSDDECTTDGESTGTGKLSAPASEYGEETKNELFGHRDDAEEDQTAWSDYDAGDLPSSQRQDDTDRLNGESQEQTPLEENFQTQSVPLLPDNDDLPSYRPRGYEPVPNHRLPFMTPIAEATESSLGTLTTHKQKELLSTKTPSRQTGTLSVGSDEDELLSSPFQEVTTELEDVKLSVLQPVRTKTTKGTISLGQGTAKAQTAQVESDTQDAVQKGPIITELQCNPMDPQLRENILSHIKPSISTFDGYHSYPRNGSKTAEIRKWAKTVAKSTKGRSSLDLANPSPVLTFDGSASAYTLRKELGAGTFAPVYLVENSAALEEEGLGSPVAKVGKLVHRKPLEAIKMEDPPSIWEYYILNQAHRRLGVSRAAESIIRAHEMHVYNDECFLVEQYRDQGTLLDLVNTCRLENTNATGMDEMLAMWLTVELLRTVEALHAKQIIHGDLKGDNLMIRFDDPGQETDWSPTYFASGAHGWSSKGVSLIDFGRGIDMKQFVPTVGFIADWKTTEADCAEMRELRPWTYQIDYYGLAGTVHSMLFGKYMETVSERGSGLPGQGATKTYRIRETFKRYWQTEIWNEVFHLLLNPLAHLDNEEGKKMPVLRGMRSCRETMESWLEENCEKGFGLKGMISKLELTMREKRRKSKIAA